MRVPSFVRLFAALALLALPAGARAQFAVYTDLASFLAATSNAGTDTFDDLTPGVVTTPAARSAGAFGYTASANTTDFFAVDEGGDVWLTTNTATDVITFNGFGPTVRGVGGFFFGTDIEGVFRPSTSLTLVATSAGGSISQALVNATTGTFLGFVATDALQSLTVEVTAQPADFAWPTVNGLVLAGPAVNVVPEPSTVLLLGAGALALGLVRRARTRTR